MSAALDDRAATQTAIAIHVGADRARDDDGRWWPPGLGIRDAIDRASRIADTLGVTTQHTLTGPGATVDALREALRAAAIALAPAATLVLSFSGHTHRGDGPLAAARWQLFDGGVALSSVARMLAALPVDVRLLLLCDSCYGAALSAVLHGPQPAIVVAACGATQTMVDRRSSEFLVRMQSLLHGGDPTPEQLERRLVDDTPDCERPCVWTNRARWRAASLRSCVGARRR